MKDIKQSHLLIILTIYAIGLVIFRMGYTNSDKYLFLIWNLFLAGIPYVITKLLSVWKRKFILFILFPIWLLFLPNAPYIITDLFHLKHKSQMPIWYDLLLIYTFAINGIVLFFISLNDMYSLIKEKYNHSKARIIIYSAIFLSGFGIFLGRYLRWNSWDIIQNPSTLFQSIIEPILHPANHPRTWGMTLGYGFFFMICFLLFKTLSKRQKAEVINS